MLWYGTFHTNLSLVELSIPQLQCINVQPKHMKVIKVLGSSPINGEHLKLSGFYFLMDRVRFIFKSIRFHSILIHRMILVGTHGGKDTGEMMDGKWG